MSAFPLVSLDPAIVSDLLSQAAENVVSAHACGPALRANVSKASQRERACAHAPDHHGMKLSVSCDLVIVQALMLFSSVMFC